MSALEKSLLEVELEEKEQEEKVYTKIKKIFKKNKIKKILFILPSDASEETFNLDLALAKRYPAFPPYGAGLLIRNIKEKFKDDISCKILDINFELLKSANLKGENFDYNIWKNLIKNHIDDFKPDLICISIMFTMGIEQAHQYAKFIKKYKETPIAIGGVAVSNDPEGILKVKNYFDFAFLYEGDLAITNFIDIINNIDEKKKLYQLATSLGDKIYICKERLTPESCQISKSPDYCDLPIGEYSNYGAVGAYNFLRNKNIKASTILSNRGCRARCTFCSVRRFNGLKVRSRSIESVIDEIKFNKTKYNISHYMWLDDDLLKDESRAIELFNRISDENLNIMWDATNGLIAAAMNDELMNSMVNSGMVGFHLGLESGNDEILRKIRKPGNKKSYLKSKEIFDKYPQIFIKGYTIIGFPNETIGQIQDTINFFCELEFHWYPLQILTPLTGTEIAENMIEQGLIPPDHKESNYRGLAAGSKSKSGGELRNREMNEKITTRPFVNFLETLDKNYVPNSKELDDIWFVADYELNYKKILKIKNLKKLDVIKKMLIQLVDEYTKENALGNTFLAYIHKKLGEKIEFKNRRTLANKYLENSRYWQVRFEALGTNDVLNNL